MFISAHGSYLVAGQDGLEQRFLCAFYDDDTPPPATARDLVKAGYGIERRDHDIVTFFRNDAGFLSSSPSLALYHMPGVDRCETFRDIDQAILPPPLPYIKEAEHISKKIHQVGIFRDKPGSYPEAYVENRNTVVSMNQSYEYYFWSEGGFYEIKEFIKEHYGEEILDYYEAISPDYPAARADFFRYLCLYAVGGVYFDLKTSFTHSLDTTIRPGDRFLLSRWYHGAQVHLEIEHMPYGEYEQYYIICAAGHPLMRRIIQQALCNIRVYRPFLNGTGSYGVLRFIGPLMYSMIVHEYRKGCEDIVRNIHSWSNGIQYSIFRNHDDHHKHQLGEKHYYRRDTPIVTDGYFPWAD